MVHGTGAKRPASGAPIRLMQQSHRFIGSSGSGFEAMIGAVGAGLTEAEGLNEKSLGFFDFADRQNRAVKSVNGFTGSYFRSGPALAPVRRILNDLVGKSGRVFETHEGLSEALLNRGGF